ncbi:MAG: alpha/beta hydrolase-fold protein [Bellilinea sp.]
MSQQDNILSAFKSSGNPVIFENRVFLCWHGKNAPNLISDLNDWDRHNPATLINGGKDFWFIEFQAQPGSYLEYSFIRNGRRIADPRNPRRTPNGMGKFNCHFTYPLNHDRYFYPWKKQPLHGELTQVQLPCQNLLAGAQRAIHYYQPPVSEPVPLLVVWDGQDYLNRVQLPWMLDALIAAGQVEPLALAMIENGKRYRTMEYACSETTLGFLNHVLLPHARQNLNLLDHSDQPGCHAICGASLGGLMALYAGLRMPEVFGKVVSQSGAFSINAVDFVVWHLLKDQRDSHLRLWLDCGKYEFLLACNQRMAGKLAEYNYSFEYKEFPAGHNYPAWQAILPDALRSLFGKSNASH